jgi:methionine-rich copper-binding protein CopC/putative copper export protein
VRIPRALRHPVAVALSAIAVLATPALLFAHAHLVKSAPAANAALDSAPTTISLWFSEAPEPKFTSVQLLDSAGAQIPLGAPTSIAQNGVTLAITRALGSGLYTVVWRTAASDGHATNGKFSFRVAVAQAAAPPAPPPGVTVTPVVPPAPPPQNASTPAAVRWAELLALLILIGSVVFRLVVLPNAALGAAVKSVAASTRWGHGWVTGAVGVLIVLLGLLGGGRSTGGWIAAAFGVVLMALSESLTGHAVSLPRFTALSVAADVTHVLGAGAWLGALSMMAAIGLPALGKLSSATAPRAGSALTRAYHTPAVDGVVLVVVSGVIAAYLRLPSFSALWTTDYGSWLFRKLVFVFVALCFGAYHWRRFVAREWTNDSQRRFARTILGELIIGLVIVALTSMLVSTQLPQ